MEYFTFFPKITYYDGLVATNIIARIRLRETVLSKATLFYDYTIPDIITRPDILSEKYYGSSNYTWVILYTNNILNPLWSWPKTDYQFNAYIKDKYGSVRGVKSELNKVHHYTLDDKYIIDERTYKSGQYEYSRMKAVTYYQYELDLNEKNRHIKLLDRAYINDISNEMYTIFKSSNEK